MASDWLGLNYIEDSCWACRFEVKLSEPKNEQGIKEIYKQIVNVKEEAFVERLVDCALTICHS